MVNLGCGEGRGSNPKCRYTKEVSSGTPVQCASGSKCRHDEAIRSRIDRHKPVTGMRAYKPAQRSAASPQGMRQQMRNPAQRRQKRVARWHASA